MNLGNSRAQQQLTSTWACAGQEELLDVGEEERLGAWTQWPEVGAGKEQHRRPGRGRSSTGGRVGGGGGRGGGRGPGRRWGRRRRRKTEEIQI